MTPLLPVSIPTTIAQNVVHATPARLHYIHSSDALEVSYDVDFTAADALTNAETVGAFNAAPFIRCPGGAATLICKPF